MCKGRRRNLKKVLIVDDEYLVRLGLRTSFHWALHGFEIVGEASNGEEALRVFDQTDPDILLTDIRMPVMDGIQLIEILKARKPQLYVAILSNHDDFSYARRAIQLGASQYILKSELKEETILSALQLASDSIVGAPSPQRRDNRLDQHIRKYLLSDGTIPDFPADALRQLEDGDYAALSCRCDTSSLLEETQASFHKACLAMLQDVDPRARIISAETDHVLRVLLLSRLQGANALAQLRDHMRLAISNLRQYYEIEFRAGVSAVHRPQELAQLIAEADEALDLCFFGTENCCVWSPAERQIHVHVAHRKLGALIEAKDWPALKREIEQLFDQLRACRSMSAAESCYIDLLSLARQTAYANVLLGESFIQEKKINYRSCRSLDHIDEMQVYIMDLYRSMLNLISGRGKRYSSIVSRTIAFIQNNYSRTISLGEAAEDACVSKSYLSLLFKQETGINFSKYLMDYRIDRAKQLLSQSAMHIYEIAEQVGFPNPYYFSKVFKEYTGESCKEYRDQHNAPA